MVKLRMAAALLVLIAQGAAQLGAVEPETTATFSIVAVDPREGTCGAAVASKYPAVGRVVPYVRAGVGAFCTQHWHVPDWGPRALDLLEQGKLPEEVLADLIWRTVRPDSWDVNGGPGTIYYWRPGRAMVARQTWEVHEDVADLLRQMRGMAW